MAVPVGVDERERGSRVPSELERLGAWVRWVRLPAGDYALARGILVERKTVADLHLTVADGRYWRQIGALSRRSMWRVVLIEGSRLGAGPIDAAAIRGVCLATSEQGVVLLRSEDALDSARWLLSLAHRPERRRRDRPVYAQRSTRAHASVPEAMLAAVPGISTVTARALLCEFRTVAGITAAGPAAWTRVPGMGERRSRALWEALHLRRPLVPRPEGAKDQHRAT